MKMKFVFKKCPLARVVPQRAQSLKNKSKECRFLFKKK